MPNPVVHFEVTGKDAKKRPTIAFFADPEEHVIGLVKIP